MTRFFKLQVLPSLSLALGLLVLVQSTDGLRAFTTEGARRLDVLSSPRQMPAIPLVDMHGERISLNVTDSSPLLVDFVFTQCPWICYAMGSSLEQVAEGLAAHGVENEVRILSISFDPARDNATALNLYRSRYNNYGVNWNVATVENVDDLPQLLDTFGITIIPLPDGGFEHNASFHLVDRTGALVEIFDFDRPEYLTGELIDRIQP